jgi:hypothetical protein
MAASTDQVMRPMSVKEIVSKAQAFEFNPHIALKYWLRTADSLLREVDSLVHSNRTWLTGYVRREYMSKRRIISRHIFCSCDMQLLLPKIYRDIRVPKIRTTKRH